MKLNTKEIAVFGMLGAFMYASKILMEALPNIHLLGTLIVAITVVYRKKALYPIYVYVLLDGLFSGFALWWLPYLYIWTVLWAVTMLVPEDKIPEKIKPIVYMSICALHGFSFGSLYAPAQALLFGLNFKGMMLWIAAGLRYDAVHGISNFAFGIYICPLVNLLRRLKNN